MSLLSTEPLDEPRLPDDPADDAPAVLTPAAADEEAAVEPPATPGPPIDPPDLEIPEELRQGSRAIDRRLALARARVAANETLFSTDGLNEGAIREMDISGVPPQAAHNVLKRYGIQIITMRLDQADAGPGFLSRARTNEGQFVNRRASGIFEVFRYGPPAIARMMQLEEAKMSDQGLDPTTSRVVRVVFGIVRTTKGYDLGVKSIEAEPVPGLQSSKKPLPTPSPTPAAPASSATWIE